MAEARELAAWQQRINETRELLRWLQAQHAAVRDGTPRESAILPSSEDIVDNRTVRRWSWR